MAFRALGIPERQAILETPHRADGVNKLHVILPFRVDGSTWVLIYPDGTVGSLNLLGRNLQILQRGAAFPADVIAEGNIEIYDDGANPGSLDRAELEEARQMAELLGVHGVSAAKREAWCRWALV